MPGPGGSGPAPTPAPDLSPASTGAPAPAVSLARLYLTDFRCFADAVLAPAPAGTTVLVGPNGAGKTSLLEAIGYLGTQRSFRGAPREAMVRTGCERAVLRAELAHPDRPVLVEAETAVNGRSRAQVNRQPARSRRTLATAAPVTVFSPDDLGVVQGGPARRRELLDDAVRLVDPVVGADLDQVDRVLRQRAALLRQAAGRLDGPATSTLDVWDERLAVAGEGVARARERLVADLAPLVAGSYGALAGDRPAPTALRYRRSWTGELGEALVAARREDVRRGATTVGPHRDDLDVRLEGRAARLEASQGEQRCLALALRLAVHHLVAARTGALPLLLLDDVFSELDPARSRALVAELPAGQALLTTAGPLPPGVEVAATVAVPEQVVPGPGRTP